MGFQFHPATSSITVDLETFCRFNKGTEFQQSMNLLAMIDSQLEKTQLEALANLNLSFKHYQQALKKLAAMREPLLSLNSPLEIEHDALQLFCRH